MEKPILHDPPPHGTGYFQMLRLRFKSLTLNGSLVVVPYSGAPRVDTNPGFFSILLMQYEAVSFR